MNRNNKGIKVAFTPIIFGIIGVLAGGFVVKPEALASYLESFKNIKGIAFALCTGIFWGPLVHFNVKKNKAFLNVREFNANKMRLLPYPMFEVLAPINHDSLHKHIPKWMLNTS